MLLHFSGCCAFDLYLMQFNTFPSTVGHKYSLHLSQNRETSTSSKIPKSTGTGRETKELMQHFKLLLSFLQYNLLSS